MKHAVTQSPAKPTPSKSSGAWDTCIEMAWIIERITIHSCLSHRGHIQTPFCFLWWNHSNVASTAGACKEVKGWIAGPCKEVKGWIAGPCKGSKVELLVPIKGQELNCWYLAIKGSKVELLASVKRLKVELQFSILILQSKLEYQHRELKLVQCSSQVQ